MAVFGDAEFKRNLNICYQKGQRREGAEDPEYLYFGTKFELKIPVILKTEGVEYLFVAHFQHNYFVHCYLVVRKCF